MGASGTHGSELEIEIPAPPTAVFTCFVDDAALTAWLGAGMGTATIDPRVGGALRVAYVAAGKTAAGEILVLEAPSRFSFTWGFEDGRPFPAGSTRVDVVLSPSDVGTRLVLRHGGLPSDAAAQDHAGGWKRCANILAEHASQGE